MKITVETNVAASVEQVWCAYTTPADIKQWNAASEDWHTTAATVDAISAAQRSGLPPQQFVARKSISARRLAISAR